MSIIPQRMALAMSTQAWSPDEHCRFRALRAVVSGKPATRAAARNSVAPAPGARTLPTEMSSTRLGSIWEREMRDLKPWARRSDATVLWVSMISGSQGWAFPSIAHSLKAPFPPRVSGVRSAHVTTTSSGDFRRMLSRPRAMSASLEVRWD